MLSLSPENREDLKKLARRLSRYRWRLAAVAGTMLASVLAQMPLPLLMGAMVDQVVKTQDVSLLKLFCIGLIFFTVFGALVGLAHTLLLVLLREQVLGTLRLALFDRLQGTRLAYFYERSSGYLSARIDSDLRQLNGILAGALLSATHSGLMLLGAVACLFVLSWRLALITVACLPPFVLAVTACSRQLRALAQTVHEVRARLGSVTQECFATVHMTKAFGTESFNRWRVREELKRLFSHGIRQEMLGALVGRLSTVVGTVTPVLLLWFGARELLAGRLTLGQFVAINALLSFVFMPLQGLLVQNISVQNALAALRRLTEILELPREAEPGNGSPRSLPRKRDVCLEAISFGYRPDRPVLQGVDLTVHEGETVAIVGPSGEGKTTLLRLLLRFHDPDSGVLRLGGIDVRQLPLHPYRESFGIVFQEPLLVGGTIEDNLRLARRRATRQELDAALEAACALEFVRELPKGYQSVLGEGGATLSAGQKMRLSLARVLLRDAPILLLDEPTSSLDPETERKVLANLEAFLRGRTAVLVSHQDAPIQIADRVCALEDGRLVAHLSREAYTARSRPTAGLGARESPLAGAQA